MRQKRETSSLVKFRVSVTASKYAALREICDRRKISPDALINEFLDLEMKAET